MKGMSSFYDPLSYVVNLAGAEMMAHYRLPHCGTSGSGMGWGPDLIAGGHQWLNHLTSCLGKVGLAPFVGDNLGSKAFSPTVIVYANEIIAQARRLTQGFSWDDTSLALDEIAQVGPGGSFLTSELTLQRFREAYYRSDIWPNLTLEEWLDRGSPRADDELRRLTRQLLAEAKPPEDHAELMARGEAFIAAL
jgi:trimethylamine--corrinoid protein Co-methyltransferase